MSLKQGYMQNCLSYRAQHTRKSVWRIYVSQGRWLTDWLNILLFGDYALKWIMCIHPKWEYCHCMQLATQRCHYHEVVSHLRTLSSVHSLMQMSKICDTTRVYTHMSNVFVSNKVYTQAAICNTYFIQLHYMYELLHTPTDTTTSIFCFSKIMYSQ